MAKKKLSNLVHAMNLFALMDERDRMTLADYVKSQTATPRKKAVKKAEAAPTLTGVGQQRGSSAA